MESMETFESSHIFSIFKISHAYRTLLSFFIHFLKFFEFLSRHISDFLWSQTNYFIFRFRIIFWTWIILVERLIFAGSLSSVVTSRVNTVFSSSCCLCNLSISFVYSSHLLNNSISEGFSIFLTTSTLWNIFNDSKHLTHILYSSSSRCLINILILSLLPLIKRLYTHDFINLFLELTFFMQQLWNIDQFFNDHVLLVSKSWSWVHSLLLSDLLGLHHFSLEDFVLSLLCTHLSLPLLFLLSLLILPVCILKLMR